MANEKELPFKPSTDKVYDVPLNMIHVPWDWNCRTLVDPMKAPSKEDADKERDQGIDQNQNSGISGLESSIEMRGQDTPVILRPLDKPLGKHVYQLVAGFRRYAALFRLAARDSTPAGENGQWSRNPTVRAQVQELNDAQAVALNGRENMARQNLTYQDFLFHCRRLRENGFTVQQIADDNGCARAYADRLIRIGQRVKLAILKHWRTAPVGITLDKLDQISTKPEAEQDKLYQEACEAQKPRTGGKAAKWKTFQAKASAAGFLLGRLHTANVLKFTGKKVKDYIRLVVTFPDDCTDKQFSDIVKAFGEGQDAGAKHDAEQAAKEAERAKKAAEKEESAKNAAKAKAEREKNSAGAEAEA